MLTVPAPDPLHGVVLSEDLAAAGIDAPEFYVEDDTLCFLRLDESDADAIAAVLKGHAQRAAARYAEEEQAVAAEAAEQTTEATLRAQAESALVANRTFLGLSSTTNAQTLAQVKALTRQNNGLIRLVLHKLDGTD